MKITIAYEASWRNSFLEGSNDEPVPKGGRKFIGSMTELKKDGNFKKHDVTLNTVMGILNRLIGDQRKLYQSRQNEDYFFKQLEAEQKIQFLDRIKVEMQEMVYIRNVSGSTDQNAFTGLIKANDPAFNSAFSDALWSVLYLEWDELLSFVLQDDSSLRLRSQHDPINTIEQLEALQKLKPVERTAEIEPVLEVFKREFGEVEYANNKGLIVPLSVYCSALYLQLGRLSTQYDMSAAYSKSGGLTGISKRGFTKKNFMDRFTTGAMKLIWGNPFLLKQKIKGQGEVTSMLTKASGELDIYLEVSVDEAKQIRQMIYDAGVSGFYLGKKGLAYVREISLSQNLNEVAA